MNDRNELYLYDYVCLNLLLQRGKEYCSADAAATTPKAADF
jgi:hypothetical protein